MALKDSMAIPAAQQPYNPAYGQSYSHPSPDSYYQAPAVAVPYQKPNYAYQAQPNAPYATGAYQPVPSHAQYQTPAMTDPGYSHNPTPQYQATAAAPISGMSYTPGYQQPGTAAAPYPPTYAGYYPPPTASQQQPGGSYQSTTMTHSNYPTYH
ncbi:hypothetical protein BGX26_007062 [Mortierella sp. AD094]|nr:hypothetical protein BGX26_007062 [Mortierella sp. AD094]